MLVQKYGGKCLDGVDNIRQVAKRVARRRQQDERILVVVSAMGQTTDELTHLAHQVSLKPPRRELDMLLTTGERVSMALLSMALHELGCPAVSFTGSQAGVFTDNSHSQARILDVKPLRLEQTLSEGKIVVLAGFQGVDPKAKEVTTLGRGGSDTTAVAMAAHFKAKRCEVLKDVNGVYSTDPKICQKAQLYQQLDYATLANMCFWGAKVLHYRSVELAQSLQVPLFVGSAKHEGQGTLISHEAQNMYEQSQVLSVNSLNEVHHYQVMAPSTDQAYNILGKFLKQRQLPWPQIIASVQESDHCRLMISGDTDQLKALDQAIKDQDDPAVQSIKSPLSSVTLTGQGFIASSLAAEALDLLAKNNIFVEKVLSHAQSLSFLVNPKDRESAIQSLHRLIV